MFNFKQINSLCFCFAFTICAASILVGQQVDTTPVVDNQEPIQQAPVYTQEIIPSFPQQQFPNQIYNGQIINGQIIEGPVFQGQIIEGPYYGGQIIQGQTVFGQPIEGNTIVDPNAQTDLNPTTGPQGESAKIAELNKRIQSLVSDNEKLKGQSEENAKLKQLAERITREYEATQTELTALREKQADIDRMANQANESAKAEDVKISELNKQIQKLVSDNEKYKTQAEENEKLKQLSERLTSAYETSQTELTALREKQAINDRMAAQAKEDAESNDNPNAMVTQQQEKIDELNKLYQESVEKNEALTSKVESLSAENTKAKNELANLMSADSDNAAKAQNQLNAMSDAQTQLEKTNQSLRDEVNRLQGLVGTAKTENENLNSQFTELTSRHEELQQLHDSNSKASAKLKQDAKLLTTRNKQYAASLASNSKTSKATSRRNSKDNEQASALLEQNENLKSLVDKTEKRNALLADKIAKLEANLKQAQATGNTLADDTTMGANLSGQDLEANNPYSISKWIWPFMIFGLAVGLYVYFTEEHRPANRLIAKDDDEKN